MKPTRQEIQKENKRALAILGTIGTLLIPGGAFVGLGRKAIGQAVKKAGSIGNTKKADTVGNRLRQAQTIMGNTVPKDRMYRYGIKGTNAATMSTAQPFKTARTVSDTFSDAKAQRTLMRAVKEGPSKFFSSGRSAKTGITKGKRTPARYSPEENVTMPKTGAQGGTSKGSLLFQNKTLKQSVEEANKKARAALGKRSSGNNPKTGIRAGKRVFGKEQSDGYAYGYDHSRIENSVNATKYTNYGSVKAERFMDKNEVKFISSDKVERARKELSKGLPKGQIDYDPKHIREKFFQNKSLTKYDIKLNEDSYPSNIIKKARSLLRKK